MEKHRFNSISITLLLCDLGKILNLSVPQFLFEK